MNPESETFTKAPSIRQGITSTIDELQAKASGKLAAYESKVRQSPEKAILIAAAAGYCLHVLPVGTLIGVPLRLTAFLAKPALLALGAMKLAEIVQGRMKQ